MYSYFSEVTTAVALFTYTYYYAPRKKDLQKKTQINILALGYFNK